MKYIAILILNVKADSESSALANAWEQLSWGEGTMSVIAETNAEQLQFLKKALNREVA